MQVDWWSRLFWVVFLTATVGVAIGLAFLAILHLFRPKVFDTKFLKQPHFTSNEILYGEIGGLMGVLLTQLTCLLILFPDRKNFSWRKLGDIRPRIPKWYRLLAGLTVVWFVTWFLIIFGTLLAVYVYERFLE